jgi:carbamoyltransferase
MNILSVTESMHDGSACIFKKNKIVASISSERLSGIKKDPEVTKSIIYSLLIESNLTPDDIDYVISSTCGHFHEQEQVDNHDGFLLQKREVPFNLMGKMFDVFYVPHHISHAAAAYYTSNFEESVAFTLDCCDFDFSTGKKLNSLYCHFKGNKLIKTFNPECYDGVRYAKTTEYLGFSPCVERAGTLMGLSSYGSFGSKWENIIMSDPKNDRIHEEPKYPKYETNLKDAMDCAKTQQKLFESRVLEYAKQAKNKLNVPHVSNLCLGGGSFLNCNANSYILNSNEYKNVHLFPACGDDGTCVGAALFFAHNCLNIPRHNYKNKELCYLGPSYPKYKPIDHKYVAQKISEGKIVAFMNGRAEFGPRALGNRSIFADPRNQHTRDWINQMVKKREWFRPFAPIVLEEDYKDWFDFPVPSPYMLFTAPVKQLEKIPAVTHVDNTSRFQTIDSDTNPDVYKIVKEFKNITGVPIILNTSLNGKGSPILESEDKLFEFFCNTPIDVAIIHGRIIEK